MNDLISRQGAIDFVGSMEMCDEISAEAYQKLTNYLEEMPSTQPDIHYRKMGEWDMFELITSVYYGKQYYFLQDDNEIVYSRASGKYMSVDKAIEEFLSKIAID